MPALSKLPYLPRPDDPTIIERVCANVLRGHPLDTAGKLAGLGHDVAPSWVRQGLAIIAQNPEVDPQELGSHAAFAAAIKDAEARFVDRNLGAVNDAVAAGGPKAWLPAMTLLERRRPDDFGRRPANITIDNRRQVVQVTALPPTVERHVLDLLRSRLEAGRPLLSEATTASTLEEAPTGGSLPTAG